MGSCAAPSAKGDDKFITTDYLQQCPPAMLSRRARAATPTCPTHPPHRSPPPAMARLFAGRIGGVSSR
ncbi:hypothetical protein, partial [Escherichia coli]|uniref:hypothetical protein n=1 Tax=Escherichia coli TaxID=562 RepID=UPI003457DAC6